MRARGVFLVCNDIKQGLTMHVQTPLHPVEEHHPSKVSWVLAAGARSQSRTCPEREVSTRVSRGRAHWA